MPSSRKFLLAGLSGGLLVLLLLLAGFFLRPLWSQSPPLSTTKPLTLETLATHPHDTKAFTQGLFYENGYLYESTGEYGSSTLRQVDVKTGKIVKQVRLPKEYFAEGLERVGDRIYQLTWREGYCFVYDKNTFELLGNFRYKGEGWGLTYDGQDLILSDGSATLRFFDPATFRQKRKVEVVEQDPATKKKRSILNLNELEYVRGEIWANVWQSNHIVRIDPQSGKVLGWIDCTVFVPEEYKAELISSPARHRNRVLNGIAFDAASDRLYITGKYWPVLYEVKLGD